MKTVVRSAVRLWLEFVLPLYSIALLIVYFYPEYRPRVLTQSMSESVLPWLFWPMVGAMLGVLGLSAALAAFFLLYSPMYLANKSLMLFGKAGWVDKRELNFYISCFCLLCLLLFLLYWDFNAFLIAGVLYAGLGPVLWRLLV